MNKDVWQLFWRGPAKWKRPFRVYCAVADISMQDLLNEALADIAKKKGIKVPS
jgi:hypothetical protein